ncbi:MAG: hypothetical protein ACE149_17400 [Armatimonadota bacterium]
MTSGAKLLFALLIGTLLLSANTAPAQDQVTAHRLAAMQYEIPGLTEEAASEWIKLLALSPQDAEARARLEALVKKQMPRWLPEEAETAPPFACEVLRWEGLAKAGTSRERVAGASAPAQQAKFLVTAVDFAAREGERWDELHESGFAHIDYGYVWSQTKRRYEARAVAHWEEPSQNELAHKALRATLVFHVLARERLGFDPTKPWGDPVDVWVTNKGEAGARAQGRSVYLYAAKTERSPGEWLRELAHEYGHVSFPGIGGFTETSDPWADGELAELLFAKWLATSAPEWMPWSVADWEREAGGERARLIEPWRDEGQDRGPAEREKRLTGAGEEQKRAFLGLALRVEETKGARYLGEVLGKCRRGTAVQFVGALGRRR